MRQCATQAITVVYDRQEWIFALQTEDATSGPVTKRPADRRPGALHESSMRPERQIPNVCRAQRVWNVVCGLGSIAAQGRAKCHLPTADRASSEHKFVGARI